MRRATIRGLSRNALANCAAGAMLAACAGSHTVSVAPAVVDPPALSHHRMFHYTGEKQSFDVPTGVTSVTVIALGAAGGRQQHYRTLAGHGGRVIAQIPVVQGERLAVFVGGAATGSSGGYNGGGSGGYSGDGESYGGGGATDIREGGDGLRYRILVAGGGGGQGEYGGHRCSVGGEGGGATAGSGTGGCYGYGGGGGSGGAQKHGGSGGTAGGTPSYGYGEPGDSGLLGDGGLGGQGHYGGGSGAAGDGGGGGGGYYGGGGGGGGGDRYTGWTDGGGGGGGSSYVERSATNVQMWLGWKTAASNGLVVLSW